VAGNKAETRTWLAMANEALKAIPDPDDRRPIEADLATIK
jgi:hypothetical protein